MNVRRGAATLATVAMAAAPATVAASQRPSYRQRLKALDIPGPQQVTVDYTPYEWLEGTRGGAAGGVIYDPNHGLDRSDLAHESFHVLDEASLTARDRLRLQRRMGKFAAAGAWDQGEDGAEDPNGYSYMAAASPSEVAADWYAAVARGTDPRKSWDSGYSSVPSRKRLMRFARELERIGKRYDLPQYKRPR